MGDFMMRFPLLPRRKAAALSNGVFLILLAFIFYSGQWWPGLLFAFGLSAALKHYLTGRRLNFIIVVALMGFLGLLTLTGHAFSLLFPFVLAAAGLFLIGKECLSLRVSHLWNPPSDSD